MEYIVLYCIVRIKFSETFFILKNLFWSLMFNSLILKNNFYPTASWAFLKLFYKLIVRTMKERRRRRKMTKLA